MQVYPDAGGFHCFVCGAGGDVIDFYQQYYSIGFRDALEKINDDFSLGLDLNPSQDERHKQNEAAERRRKRLLAIRSEQERLESAYNNALTNWQYWDSLKQKSAPRSFTDELSDTYVFACQHIEQAADELGRAEAALQAFRLERKNKSG